jgi:tetratricopeptide (TPR) repeat protein
VKRIIALLMLAAAASGETATPSFDDISTRAQQAYEANRLDDATRLFDEAVKLRPEWAEGWWALGMIAYQQDRYPECRDALSHMVAQDATAAPGWALLGLCEFQTKQYDLSLQHLKKGHMLVPVREGGGPLLDMADYHLALLLTRQGAFELAQEVLVRVALKVRDKPDMFVGAGLACLRLPILPDDVPANQRDVVTMAGKTFWDLISQPPPEAEADFKTLILKYPNIPNVHYYYGTYLASHRPEQCTREFLQELRVSPDSVPARVQLVLRYIVDAKLTLALRYAREAVALSPESVGAHLALAETFRAQGKDQDALAAFLEAKKLDPVSPKIRLYLVNQYRALGNVEAMRSEQSEYERLKTEQQNWP